MEFIEFWPLCKYQCPGTDGSGGYEPTCRRPDRRPPGISWEKCKEEYCPYFGKVGENVKIIIDEKVIATAENIKFVMCSEGKEG